MCSGDAVAAGWGVEVHNKYEVLLSGLLMYLFCAVGNIFP